MSDLPKFSKGEIKKTGYFGMWVFAAVMVIFIGIITVVGKEFSYRRSPPITGSFAVFIGLFFIAYGAYMLFHLLFRAEKEEKGHHEYHALEDFESIVDGYKVKFSVLESSVAIGNSARTAYYYVLLIEFKKNLFTNLYIKQRDRFEYVGWKAGFTRFLDTLTRNYYFDSRYKVTCHNKERFRDIFTVEVLKLLELFDRDYPPIRAKNGILEIEDNCLRYSEGPYSEEYRIFDPHRGVIEDLFNELINIISAIENNVPLLPDEAKERNLIASVREMEKERRERRDRLISKISNMYTSTAYAPIVIIISFSLMVHLFK